MECSAQTRRCSDSCPEPSIDHGGSHVRVRPPRARWLMSVLFVGKRNHTFCAEAAKLLLEHDPHAGVVMGLRGEPAPAEFETWEGDYIVSYLSPWIVPEPLLNRARRAAINFHPGPPEYPGIGCTNFALYNNETSYGVTCHHMVPKVDTGAIISVKRFAVSH